MESTTPTAPAAPAPPPGADTPMPDDIAAALRRYLQIQREAAALEREKAGLRDFLVHALGDLVPAVWHPTLDATPLRVQHGLRTTVRYDEPLLRERLGERFPDLLEIDAAKIRKNRDLVRPLLLPVLDRVGSVQAARVERAIRFGAVSPAAFRGAFSKSSVPSISVRIETPPPPAPSP